jgi:hypothetical protein
VWTPAVHQEDGYDASGLTGTGSTQKREVPKIPGMDTTGYLLLRRCSQKKIQIIIEGGGLHGVRQEKKIPEDAG